MLVARRDGSRLASWCGRPLDIFHIYADFVALVGMSAIREGVLRSLETKLFFFCAFVFSLSSLMFQGVRSQIEDVRAGMLENVDKVLERGEKIEVGTARHAGRLTLVYGYVMMLLLCDSSPMPRRTAKACPFSSLERHCLFSWLAS